MIQERRAPSRQSNLADADKIQALQQLGKDIYPFQESPMGKRTRAIGLKNLYLQMADPSREFINSIVDNLIILPFNSLRQLQFATFSAGDNSNRFFANHRIIVEDPVRLLAGISNTEELLDSIISKHDLETGELFEYEKLNPKEVAGNVYQIIKIRKEERQIRRAAEQVRGESDLKKRCRMGLELKRQVLDYVGSFTFRLSLGLNQPRPLDPSWDNLTSYSDFSINIETEGGIIISGRFGIKDATNIAQAAILRDQFESGLEKIPPRDRERFDQLRLQYGAKAANLIMLSKLVASINELRDQAGGIELVVPDFQTIPVDTYRAWKAGELIDDRLRSYFEWAKRLKVYRWQDNQQASTYFMVRSSAVFSEDGETVTGAGVYNSVIVPYDATFEDFKNGVIKVYESTESQQAQAYRTQHGIDSEEMGLVIQKFVSPGVVSGMFGNSQEGYINSRLAGVPQLMEIVTKTSRNFINREELDFFLAMNDRENEEVFRDSHHFKPDLKRIDPRLPIRVAQLTYVIERIWGRNVQIEFVAESSTINIVQVRELPVSSSFQAQEVHFPDEAPVYSSPAIGVGDMELTVLNSEGNNSKKSGFVVFAYNYGWTIWNNNNRLPKEGAVIISGSTGDNGHIQTLCAEKGLICLFPDKDKDDLRDQQYEKLSALQKVRVVSNGIEARLYSRQQAAEVKIQPVDFSI